MINYIKRKKIQIMFLICFLFIMQCSYYSSYFAQSNTLEDISEESVELGDENKSVKTDVVKVRVNDNGVNIVRVKANGKDSSKEKNSKVSVKNTNKKIKPPPINSVTAGKNVASTKNAAKDKQKSIKKEKPLTDKEISEKLRQKYRDGERSSFHSKKKLLGDGTLDEQEDF